MSPNKFLTRLLIFTLLLIGITYVLNSNYNFSSNYILYSLGFVIFILISFLTYRNLHNAVSQRPALFVNRFMASIVIKLFVFIALLISVGFSLEKVEVKVFAVFYLSLYLLYTIFLTSHMLKLKNGLGEKA